MGRASERSVWLGGVLRRVGAVVAFAGLVMSVLPLVAGAEHVNTWPDSAAANHAEYWEDWGLSEEGESDWTCVKVEPGSDDPFLVGSPPPDEVWRLLVVKAGSDVNDLHWSPLPGEEYEHSIQGGWSHVILCSVPEEEEEESTTTLVEETTTTMVEETTTTVVEGTTTTDPVQITTTTVGSTTSTVSDEVLPIVVTTTTAAPTSTVADEVEGTQVVAVTLPFTGPATEGFGQLGLALLALGALLVAATRSRRGAAEE